MTYLEQDICFETKFGDGSSSGMMGKFFGMGKRMLTGESIFQTRFTNERKQKRHVAFAAPSPGSVIPLNLAQLNQKYLPKRFVSGGCFWHPGGHRLAKETGNWFF